MKRTVFWIALLAAALLAFVSIRQASAQSPTQPVTDDQVNAVARQLYCPVCENIPLDVCPTTACAKWRALIKQKLEIGWNNQQIRDYFAQQYGDRVLSEPPARGLNWLVYALPPVFILAGIALLVVVIRQSRRRPVPAQSQPPTVPSNEPVDEYSRRIEEELKRRESS